MTSEKDIKIIELFEGDYGVEVTNNKLKIKTGPLFDPFLRIVPVSRYARGRRTARSTVIEEIPLRNINTIAMDGNNLKITWVKESKKPFYKVKETKIKMKPFKSILIKEAISKLMKGEDPEKLAIEYSKILSRHFRTFQDERNVILIKGDYIEIYSKEIYEIISGKIPIISRSSMFIQALTSYSEKIPISKIRDIKIEKINDRRFKVEMKLKEKGCKTLIFNDKKNAEELVDTTKKILEITGKEREKIVITSKGELILRGKIEDEGEWKRSILENTTKFLVLFVIIYTIFSEAYERSIMLALITTLISLIILTLWNKLRD